MCILALPHSRSSRDVAIYRRWRSCLSMRLPSCRWGSPRAYCSPFYLPSCISAKKGSGRTPRRSNPPPVAPGGNRADERCVRFAGLLGLAYTSSSACKTAETRPGWLLILFQFYACPAQRGPPQPAALLHALCQPLRTRRGFARFKTRAFARWARTATASAASAPAGARAPYHSI